MGWENFWYASSWGPIIWLITDLLTLGISYISPSRDAFILWRWSQLGLRKLDTWQCTMRQSTHRDTKCNSLERNLLRSLNADLGCQFRQLVCDLWETFSLFLGKHVPCIFLEIISALPAVIVVISLCVQRHVVWMLTGCVYTWVSESLSRLMYGFVNVTAQFKKEKAKTSQEWLRENSVIVSISCAMNWYNRWGISVVAI